MMFFLTKIINNHAPSCKLRVKGQTNLRFIPKLSNLLKERDTAWAKAKNKKKII